MTVAAAQPAVASAPWTWETLPTPSPPSSSCGPRRRVWPRDWSHSSRRRWTVRPWSRAWRPGSGSARGLRGQQAQWVAELAARASCGAEVDLLPDEIATRLAITRRAAERKIELAAGLRRHPRLAAVLDEGSVSVRKVEVLLEEGARAPAATDGRRGDRACPGRGRRAHRPAAACRRARGRARAGRRGRGSSACRGAP